jgi:2-oxoglutarate dehydrogenase E1 component
MRILSDPIRPHDKDVKRLVLCSGKVAYDLMEARDAAGILTTVSIVRLEQLYPFPGEPLALRLKRMTGSRRSGLVPGRAAQQRRMVLRRTLIEECAGRGQSRKVGRARYAGRKASASPATGLAKRHAGRAGRAGCRCTGPHRSAKIRQSAPRRKALLQGKAHYEHRSQSSHAGRIGVTKPPSANG